jgi:hypothetical protein
MSMNTDNVLTIKETSSGPSGGLITTHLVCIPPLLIAAMHGFSLLRSGHGLSAIQRLLILLVLLLLGISYGQAVHTIRRVAHAMPSSGDPSQRLLALVESL